MRRRSFSIGIGILFACFVSASAARAAVTIDVSTSTQSGASLGAVPVGDFVTFDLVFDNPFATPLMALEVMAEQFDPTILQFEDGLAVANVFSIFCSGPGACFGALQDPEPIISEFPAPDEIQIYGGVSISQVISSNAMDYGVDGQLISAGDVHARVTFQALGVGTTTIVFDREIFCSGVCDVLPELVQTTVTVVPEPGTALLVASGLCGLAARIRRREAR